eukprot:2346684-Rhodomonas_salina.1
MVKITGVHTCTPVNASPRSQWVHVSVNSLIITRQLSQVTAWHDVLDRRDHRKTAPGPGADESWAIVWLNPGYSTRLEAGYEPG